jgi:hypothetical protein
MVVDFSLRARTYNVFIENKANMGDARCTRLNTKTSG